MQVILPREISKKKLFFEPLEGENELSLNSFWEFGPKASQQIQFSVGEILFVNDGVGCGTKMS